MNELVTLWAFIVAAFVIGAFAGVAYTNTRQRGKPKTKTPLLTPAKFIPDDVVISNNWETVYQNRNYFGWGHGIWESSAGFNKVRVTIRPAIRGMHKRRWEVDVEIFGGGKYPFSGHTYVDSHTEFIDWLRKKYPFRYVHSLEYVDFVIDSVSEEMRNPAKNATEFFGREVNY